MVINHWDLLENNIYTGHLTGIVDWGDAEVGMRFHPQHIQLRRLFWQKLYEEIGGVSEGVKEAIHTARMIGIFLANGDFAGAPADAKGMEEAVLKSITLELFDVGLKTSGGSS
ncbi:Protein kinase-like protein [Penicillium tannophilum]|nr:Protein kinase-like protein [Penicillium tannophilum]